MIWEVRSCHVLKNSKRSRGLCQILLYDSDFDIIAT